MKNVSFNSLFFKQTFPGLIYALVDIHEIKLIINFVLDNRSEKTTTSWRLAFFTICRQFMWKKTINQAD